jgi:protein gp37
MAKDTKISWAHHTVNWWTGCSKVSAECKNCYAEALVKRMGRSFADRKMRVAAAMKEAYAYDAQAKALGKRAIVFTNSLADFFDPAADTERDAIWEVIRRTPNLYWMILTKRPHLIAKRLPSDWGDGWENVWLGTTCGSKKAYRCDHTGALMTPLDRVKALQAIPCRVRFISAEPLLEDISAIDLTGIHWIAAGGESGPEWNYADRRMNIAHAAALYEKCKAEGIRFLFKQASHQFTERGINALNLYRAEQVGERIDSKTCELIREYPVEADGKLMQFNPPGPSARFSMSDWRDYKAKAPVCRLPILGQ